MDHRPNSKISKILGHLRGGNNITPLKAIGLYSAFRLASDIQRLRLDHDITTTIRTAPNGATYAEYSLRQCP